MKQEIEKEYIYITQASLEPSRCKIGKTNDYERRLKEYNNITGKSQENVYTYLFVCEVSDSTQLEKDLKEEFSILRQAKSREIFLYSPESFSAYVNFIKGHSLFVSEIFIKTKEKKEQIKIVKKETPSLKERKLTPKDVMQKAQKVKDDEFYTRYEDVEKEVEMYDKKI